MQFRHKSNNQNFTRNSTSCGTSQLGHRPEDGNFEDTKVHDKQANGQLNFLQKRKRIGRRVERGPNNERLFCLLPSLPSRASSSGYCALWPCLSTSSSSSQENTRNGSHRIDKELNTPSYFDLGKHARELFNTGYHFGLLSLNLVTKSPNKVKFTTACIENLKQGNLFGSVEAKYELPDFLTVTERWNTDCIVTTEICCKNKPCNGVSATFAGSISPRSGDKTYLIKSEWKNKFCTLNSQIDLKNRFSSLTTSAVIGYRGLLWGILTKYDIRNHKLIDINLAAGFSTDDFILHTTFSNGSECGGSIFHKLSPKADAGVDVMYSTNKKSDILFGVAGRYQIDDDVCIRGKINNSSQLGLGLEQRLRDCIVLTWSVLFDIRNFESGKHKLGLSVQFES